MPDRQDAEDIGKYMIKEGVFCEKESDKGLGDAVIRLPAAGVSRLR